MKKTSQVHRNARFDVRRSEGSTVPRNLKKSKQLQLPLHLENISFQTLEFVNPFRENAYQNKKYNFEASEFVGVPGLVVIKENNKLVRINSSKNDLYRVYTKNIRRRNGHAKDFKYCIIEVPEKLQPIVKEKIRESYNNCTLTNTFTKIKDLIENAAPVPLRMLKFIEPYYGTFRNNKVRTLGHYKGRPGVYLIKRNKKIVYIGMASCLTERCYSHFIRPDLIWGKGQVNYFDELSKGVAKFTIAFIEFPKSITEDGKTSLLPKTEVRILCEKYERILITQFKPRDNQKGHLEPEEVIFTQEEIDYRKTWEIEPPF